MRIREVEAADLESLLALYGELHAEDGPPADRAAEVWEEILGNDHVRICVAELRGALVGSCALVLVPNLTRAARPYALIENVVTASAHRRQGVGTSMLHHALKEAWAAGCYKVMLLSGSTREETLRFYEKAGFERGVKTGFVARPPI